MNSWKASNSPAPARPPAIAELEDISEFGPLDHVSIMTRLQQKSFVTGGSPANEPAPVPEYLRYEVQQGSGIEIKLPGELPESSISLLEALYRRTAVRYYDPAPVSMAHLAAVLKVAQDADKQEWQAEYRAGLDLRFYVIAWRVAGVEPAIYYYNPARHSLVYVNRVPVEREGRVNWVPQIELAEAPVLIAITGNLVAADLRDPVRGYNQILLRAGQAGQRMWFTSIGLRLAGLTFSSILPREANRHTDINGYTNASLFTYGFGYQVGSVA